MLGFLTILMSFPLFFTIDPDFGWHIYLGKWMYAHHQLVQTLVGYNYFSNRTLIDHQWLSDLIFYQVFHYFGYGALIVLSAVALFTTVALLYKILRLQANQLISLFVCSLFLLSYTVAYGVRIQLLLFLGAALFLYVYHFIKHSYFRFFWYALILIVGNNLHGGFIVLALIPILLELSAAVRGKITYKTFFVGLLIIIGALFVNPNGIAYWHLMHDYLVDGYYQQHIAEWLPIYAMPIYWPVVISLTIGASILFSMPLMWRKT